MYLLFYTLYRIVSCIKQHQNFFKQEMPYLCFKYYLNDKTCDKKGMMKVLAEVNHLCKYWRQFPNTYFMFCHYRKDFHDMKQMESFLPQGAYWKFCSGGIENGPYQLLISDKILFHELMNYYGLPVPKMLFVYKNHQFFVDSELSSDESIDKILNECFDSRIFVKFPSVGAAKGVFLMERCSDGYYIDNNKVTAAYLRERFRGRNVFFEKQLEQEPIMKSFNPDTINTIRVLTKNIDGKKEIVMAAARFGRKGQFVDNMHAGGIGVSIDIETGRLGAYGGRRFEAKRYDVHPDSGMLFRGVEVPQWDEIKKVVFDTLTVFPPYRSVGFDIVTTPIGPVVLEINTGAGMDLAQVGKEYGIAKVFYPEKF